MDSAALKHGHLNPHEPPPQELRDIFKTWKGAPKESISELEIASDSWVLLGTISGNQLQTAFQDFTATPRDDVPEPASLYGFPDLPGLFIIPSLLPPPVQKELLSRLLHRDLSDPKHKTNLHLHYDVTYPIDGSHSFFSVDSSTTAFHPKDANVHKPLTVEAALEKKIRWVTLGGQYDWTSKVYPLEEPPQFPQDIASLIKNVFTDIEPQAAIVNLYSPGDTLSLHRDVSEEVDKGLVSVSLGCDAIFIIGLHDTESAQTQSAVLRLKSGDALYMTKESRFAWHGVPKIVSGTCPEYLSKWPGDKFSQWEGWMDNKRINLNIRQMRDSSLASAGMQFNQET